MLLSELIQKLQEIKDKQGDAHIMVDSDDFDYLHEIIAVDGKDYQNNTYIMNGEKANWAFIIIGAESL